MLVLHLALQGCLKADGIDYGVTPDTGGHIRYVLELAAANRKAGIGRQIIVTRRFHDTSLGSVYDQKWQSVAAGVDILRIGSDSDAYRVKEELWRETGSLAENLLAEIATWQDKPDIVHAHYADAGIVALALKKALGIPFVFTGHSLGRVKAEACAARGDPVLLRRIAREERVLAAADKVIASSRDEAEHQYALYDNIAPERIVLNPPGCDLSAFSSEGEVVEGEIDALAARFLDDPSKPPVLALARPVRKKNLKALIHAFGMSKELRERANLVIFAGVRDDLRKLDEEGRAVVEELLYLIDRYDLYGRVAIPKHHRASDVPQVYRWAAARKGVFANPALNEPFGLTILEAAASGLPVVATKSGGPAEIISRLRCGRLIDPHEPLSFAEGALELLRSERAWREAADEGPRNVLFYSWPRHARDYRKDLEGVMRPRLPALAFSVRRSKLFVSDIDNTLVGEAQSLRAFARWRCENRGFHFAIATGRSLQDAIRVLREWQAPMPEVLITSVGSEIYYSRDFDLRHLEADEEWLRHIGQNWHPERVRTTLADIEGLVPQAPCEQRPHKISYFTARPAGQHEIAQRLVAARLDVTVVHSHGEYLDILPKRASKGQALGWLARKLGIPMEDTVAAGDSGNDIDLLLAAGTGIVVGNHEEALASLKTHPRAYFAKDRYAAGIMEALNRRRP